MSADTVQALSERLRQATHALHRQVEARPFVQQLLRGNLERRDYCRLLRSLVEVYEPLEAALRTHAGDPVLAAVALPSLFRSQALADDLRVLHGDAWRAELPVCAAAASYRAHLQALDTDAPALLAAHAYVRYLGDLSGGQLLARAVLRSQQLAGPQGTDFYRFEPGLAEALRAGLDLLPGDAAAHALIVAEACSAFERHAALFEELEAG